MEIEVRVRIGSFEFSEGMCCHESMDGGGDVGVEVGVESEEVEECFEIRGGDVTSGCGYGCIGVLILVLVLIVVGLLHTLPRSLPKRHSNRRFSRPIPPCEMYHPMQNVTHMCVHPDRYEFAYIVRCCCSCGGGGGGDGEVV